MIRPESATVYDQIDLKLGIKSSLPSVKPTLALLFLMWREMGRPSELEYSSTQGNAIVLRTDIEEKLYQKLQEVSDGVTLEQFRDKVNNNLMFKAQLEALLVAFELVWKVAKIRFSDGKPNSTERTGGSRFPKKLWFTLNMDLLDAVCGDDTDYIRVFFLWLGFELNADIEKEKNIIRFLTAISESAYYKLIDNGTDVVFNLESVYKAVLSHADAVDISGDKEAKGSLRILKSALTENLISNLSVRNNAVTAIDTDALRRYADRVAAFHQLEPKVYITAPATEPAIDLNDLRQEWMDKENQEFILACLDFMKSHGLFTDSSLETLQNKEQCAELFSHNSLNGILLRVNPELAEDEQRKDANGNARYYSEKYVIGNTGYFVSSEWRPDREDARKPLIDWIFAMMQEIKFSTGYHSEFSRNRILFGAPGTGKSFTLNGDRKELLYGDRNVDENTIDRSMYGEYERVTFHPDYSYANFVGTYKPVPCKDSDGKDAITYSYVPGPFMRTYVKALQNSRTDAPKPFLLVIEEINRANVAAVFGDVFQLLDRGDDEVSEYPIQASEDIKKYLAGELGGNPDDYSEIRIPDNMFIWATMNSADQGVFPMDTAFKRRWDFTYLGIDDSESGIVGKKVILGQGDYRRIVEWNALRKAINNELLTYKVNEDKLMGPYFISKKNLPEGEIIDPAVFTRIFKNKVIMYLFDDAAKQKRLTLFGGCDEKAKNQYSKICREFDTKGVYIFCEAISSQFIDNVPEDDGE
ncbi:AAA family ATPase [Acetivibrio sp. MSJd-27]|uniref:AAA family ATPase n=1 Tax=Acetivibrio sp. MSJd-27 TaxID=2841523 RepID=UPI001C0FB3D3|nr:AAA family ATPase [Acetivibrio sp. MSJd-27]MBU5450528.1 AAA family ATPase [Acetivibrio sp. MSJd-27]